MRIFYYKQAQKYIFKQDAPTKTRIKEAVENLTHKPPKGDIIPLKGEENRYRVRVGNFRMKVEFDTENNKIIIFEIGSRGDFYK